MENMIISFLTSLVATIFGVIVLYLIASPSLEIYPVVAVHGKKIEFSVRNRGFFSLHSIRCVAYVGKTALDGEQELYDKAVLEVPVLGGCFASRVDKTFSWTPKEVDIDSFKENWVLFQVESTHSVSGLKKVVGRKFRIKDLVVGNFQCGVLLDNANEPQLHVNVIAEKSKRTIIACELLLLIMCSGIGALVFYGFLSIPICWVILGYGVSIFLPLVLAGIFYVRYIMRRFDRQWNKVDVLNLHINNFNLNSETRRKVVPVEDAIEVKEDGEGKSE